MRLAPLEIYPVFLKAIPGRTPGLWKATGLAFVAEPGWRYPKV